MREGKRKNLEYTVTWIFGGDLESSKHINNVHIFNNVFSQSHIEGNTKQSHENICKIIKTKTGLR